MTKNNFTLGLFVVVGLLGGTMIGELGTSIAALKPILRSFEFSWSPAGHFMFLTYDLDFGIRLNIMSLIGLVGAVWLHHRL